MNKESERIEFLKSKRKVDGLTCTEEADLNKLKGGKIWK